MSEIDENKNTFFCRKCGSKVAEDHCFCEKCGAKIVRENDAKVTAIPQNAVHNNVQNGTVPVAEPGDSVNSSTEPVTNTTDSNAQNVTVNNSANSDSSTNVEYSQNFVQVNPKKKPAPIKIVIPVVILCVLAAVLIAPLIDANPVVSNRLVGKCKNSNETTYVFNENGIRYYYNSHIFGIMALSDDFKDATFDRIHLSESDLQ